MRDCLKMTTFKTSSPANDNRVEVPAGMGYYPEMGERAPSSAIVEASLSHYGKHYYIKFSKQNETTVMSAIKALKLRFTNFERFTSCITNEVKVSLTMTAGAYDKFRAANRAVCTQQFLLD